MRCSLLLFIMSIFQVQAISGFAQKTELSLSFRNASVEAILSEIEEQSRFYFLCNRELIDLKRKTSIVVENQPIDKILDEIFRGTNVTYKIMDRQIVLSPDVSSFRRDQNLPPQELSGKVKGEDGTPLPGVTVIIKGTTQGTITNAGGDYFLSNVPADAILVFSFVGMRTQEVKVGGQTSIAVVMQEETIGIEEVVAVGYGTMKKRDLTGSVASVTSESLTVYPTRDAIQALQGMAAGVQVQSTNGAPGSGYNISIRGNNSINAGSDPLIVVDGFPEATMPPSEDIQSIEILKDASSTAIFGSRGANGVILVTTRSGKTGKFQIDFNSSLSFQKEINRLEVLNATEYATYINEIDPGYYETPSSYGIGTNWQDVIYRTGQLQNYQLSVSGGSDKITYYLSGNYYDQKGIIIHSGYSKYSFTSNIKAQVLEWINVGANIFAQHTDLDGVNSQTGGYYQPSVPDLAYKFMPTVGIYKEDGTYTITDRGERADNPYANATEYSQERISDITQGNFFAELDLLKGLKFRTVLGLNSVSGRSGRYVSSKTERGGAVDGEANLSYYKHSDVASENYFTYTADFNEIHHLNAMAGYSYQSFHDEEMSIETATDFPTDGFLYWNLGAATGIPVFDSALEESKLVSFYGRLNYGFRSRYLFTFTARYDGSSRFAKNNKWAFFPSGAFAWNLMEEGFMAGISSISQLKFRASYGISGNQAVEPYQSLASLTDVFTTSRGTIIPAIKPGTISNPNLTWESTAQTDIGIDVGLFESRFTLTADYYKKITSDLLFNVPVPKFSGFSTQLQNIGEIENNGLEFTAGAKILTGKLNWTTNANISFNRNKIRRLVENEAEGNAIYYGTAPLEGASGLKTQILKEGEAVGTFYGFVYEGVLQAGETPLTNGEGVGGEKFKDITPDGILNDGDRTILGSPHPDFIWGWNNQFSYRNLDLNIFIQGSQGGQMIDYTRMELGIMNGRSNCTKDVLDRWTATHTDTDIPRANMNRGHVFSDRWVEDASYARLKNITLGYNFDKNLIHRLKLRSARIYVSAQNLFTITGYKGVDPEVAYRSSNMNIGLDYASYPNSKSVTVGINLGL